jgi:hypothetical protein
MSNIKFSLGIYNKRFNCHGPNNKNQKCPANPSLPKNSILMPNPPNISTKTRQAAAIRIQSQGGGRMRLGGIKGGGIPPSTPAIPPVVGVEGWKDTGEGPKEWGGGAIHAIASNDVGDRLVALANNVSGPSIGKIIRSSDYGVTWLPYSSPLSDEGWRAIASDSTGKNLVSVTRGSNAVPPNDGRIWLSTDYGDTWNGVADALAPHGTGALWRAVASSANGNILSAGLEGGPIWISANAGLNWALATTHPTNGLKCLTSNALGDKMAATVNLTAAPPNFGGDIWLSADYGDTWNKQPQPPPPSGDQMWWGIASDALGSTLVAASIGNLTSPLGGNIWLSTDYGQTWTKQTGPSLANWEDVAVNSAGTVLVAVAYGGDIWKSTDSGVTWIKDTTVGAIKNWRSVASNSSGDRLASVVFGGNIWTWPVVAAVPAVPAFSCAPSPPYPMACIKPPRNTF